MKVKVTTWKISTLWRLKDNINPQPVYQRGEVWRLRKNALLVDSILRGIDIPKIYLRKMDRSAHEYEVADGQQRLNAILSFYDNGFPLLADEEKGLNLRKIGNTIVGNKRFTELSTEFQERFSNYDVTIAIVEEASNAEIRTLFGRLQEGEPLAPAEKRNAIISKIGGIVDNFALHHDFFLNSRIPEARFKRQDYLSHGLALLFYENLAPLKADLLLRMYLDKDLVINQELQSIVAETLDLMFRVDQRSQLKIYKKYHFVDFFWFFALNLEYVRGLSESEIARKYDEFETLRLNISDPESLIVGNPNQEDKDLYYYYRAFKSAGAEPSNIDTRHEIFSRLFQML